MEDYDITQQEMWSLTVRKRAISWLGHLLRLYEKTHLQEEHYMNF